MVSSILLGLLFIVLLIIGLFVGLITVLALGSIMGIKIEYTVYTLDDEDHWRIMNMYAPEIALGGVDFFVEVLALEH